MAEQSGALTRGSNQAGVRKFNERLILTHIRSHASVAKAQIARITGLSPQTVSGIIQQLEADGLVLRGEPIRGRVGQPSVPISLNPDGAYSFGLKIGRRSADLELMNFAGEELARLHLAYHHPLPEHIIEFATEGARTLSNRLSEDGLARIVGLGIAMPFELWNWVEQLGAEAEAMSVWRSFDIRQALEDVLQFPVSVQNDATLACGAELVLGGGGKYRNFVYFNVGFFVGGGVVLDGALYPGASRNAGALGSMLVSHDGTAPAQLIETASLARLETMIVQAGRDPSHLWISPDDWGKSDGLLDIWIRDCANALAQAIANAASVIDFPAAIVDGACPAAVRERLVEATTAALAALNTKGIALPTVEAGTIGSTAQVKGGALMPLRDRYLTDHNVLYKDV